MTKLSPLADINLRKTYRAIDSVATGRIPSLFCDISKELKTVRLSQSLFIGWCSDSNQPVRVTARSNVIHLTPDT